MNVQNNIESIYRHERSRWMKEEAPRKAIRDVIADSVPYWIVVVAFVLYGLSAPHTASVFDRLTPGYGFLAPVGVEFGLLYAAFRRRLAKDMRQTVPHALWVLEVLLFVTAMLVNGAGAFTSVVASAKLEALSFAAIVERFGNLPATSQAALVMAVLAAFIIPIGAQVAGEGLAAIVLEQRSGSDFREMRWREVEFTVIYRAVFTRYMQHGLTDKEAKSRALSEVKGYLATTSTPVRSLSAGSEQGGQKADTPPDTVKGKVREFLAAHPELADFSIKQVMETLSEAEIQVGRTTVAEVLQERRNGHNGVKTAQ